MFSLRTSIGRDLIILLTISIEDFSNKLLTRIITLYFNLASIHGSSSFFCAVKLIAALAEYVAKKYVDLFVFFIVLSLVVANLLLFRYLFNIPTTTSKNLPSTTAI